MDVEGATKSQIYNPRNSSDLVKEHRAWVAAGSGLLVTLIYGNGFLRYSWHK